MKLLWINGFTAEDIQGRLIDVEVYWGSMLRLIVKVK
jgi:hypothetical protein